MVKSGTVKLDCGTASFSVNQPSSNINPGSPICTADVTDTTPRLMQIVTNAYIDAFCKDDFKSSVGTEIVMKGGLGIGFINWLAWDKNGIMLPMVPEIKATKDEKFCGPTEDFDKVSGNVSVDRCKQNLGIALDNCTFHFLLTFLFFLNPFS